jgi:hypothetical protein
MTVASIHYEFSVTESLGRSLQGCASQNHSRTTRRVDYLREPYSFAMGDADRIRGIGTLWQRSRCIDEWVYRLPEGTCVNSMKALLHNFEFPQ